jgi:large subunit ribosomal protein L28
MAACAICGKTAVSGSNVSHSVVHTKRRFRPNLQAARVDGRRVLICMRCKRTLQKQAAARA